MVIAIGAGQRSLQTALTIQRLAAEIAIPRAGLILKKVAPGIGPDHQLPELDAPTML